MAATVPAIASVPIRSICSREVLLVPTASSVRLAPAAWDDPDVQRPAEAQQAELRARYDGGSEPGTPPSAADLAIVLLARDEDETAIGCGALRGIADGVGELKRMFVVPSARGRGVARLVLAALEDEARSRGWTTLRLETGPRQPEVIALYIGAGYRPTGAFGAYVADANTGDSLFFERVLAGPGERGLVPGAGRAQR